MLYVYNNIAINNQEYNKILKINKSMSHTTKSKLNSETINVKLNHKTKCHISQN